MVMVLLQLTINKSQNHDDCMVRLAEVGITIPISSILLFFKFSSLPKEWLHIIFIYGRCCCSLAVVTPVKYESHSKNLTGIFANSKIRNGEINEWNLSNPHPSHPWSVPPLPMFLCSPATLVSAFSTYWDCNMKRASMRFYENYI